MKNITRLPGMAHLTDAEYEAFILNERKEYNKRLKMICPFKDIREQAKKIAAELSSCGYCIYANSDDGCRIPHTEAYVEVMGIDPCYEGVLFRLCKEAEREETDRKEAAGNAAAELKKAYDTIYGNLKTIAVLCDLVIKAANSKKPFCPATLECVRSLSETAQGIMDDWDLDEDALDDDCEYDFSDDEEFDYDIDDDDDWDFDDEKNYTS